MTEPEEWFPVLDAADAVIGRARREDCHAGTGLLHPVVHCRIVNAAGDLLLQRRSMAKKIQPGKWDTSVGGHVQYGESVEAALTREIEEEVGVPARVGPPLDGGPVPALRYPPGTKTAAATEAAGAAGESKPGARPLTARFAFAYTHRNAVEAERVFVFMAEGEGPFAPQPGEVDELRFWRPADLAAPESAAGFTPNLLDEQRRFDAWRTQGSGTAP